MLVIDEADSVRARQMEQALRLAEQAGARVVLLGDTRQTKAIEAGRPFDQLHGAGMATALMQQIERQKDTATGASRGARALHLVIQWYKDPRRTPTG